IPAHAIRSECDVWFAPDDRSLFYWRPDRPALGSAGRHLALCPLYRFDHRRWSTAHYGPGHLPGLASADLVSLRFPLYRADRRIYCRAMALRNPHWDLVFGDSRRRRILDRALGTDRTGALHAPDGVSGGSRQVCSTA